MPTKNPKCGRNGNIAPPTHAAYISAKSAEIAMPQGQPRQDRQAHPHSDRVTSHTPRAKTRNAAEMATTHARKTRKSARSTETATREAYNLEMRQKRQH